jgi:zinc protease
MTLPSIEATRVVLDNGMTVILKEIHYAPIVSFQAYVKVGSIYEGKFLGTGISHFIEHVIDDGTERRTREDIDNLVEAMGNASNAYTTKDHCQYEVTTSVQHLDLALDVLADYLTRPTFPAAEVETQRGVIWNELNGDLDEPTQLLHDLYYETAFRQHPARFPVGGYKELFMALMREDLVEFYRQHYVPSNMIFVAAGDFQTNEMLDKIDAAFRDFSRRISPVVALPAEPPQLAPRRAERFMNVELGYLSLGAHTTRMAHSDAVALDLVATLLGGGESSRLVQTLKNRRQLVFSVQAWSDTPPYDAGCFGIDAEIEPNKLTAAETEILAQVEQLKSAPVSEIELERAKVIEASEYLFTLQSVEEQGAMLGADELATGDYRFHETYLQRIYAVTPEDIQRVAHAYFRPENLTAVVIRPGVKPRFKSTAKTAASSEKVVPQGQFSLVSAPVRKSILPNGIRLLTKSIDAAPVVTIQAMFLGGTRFETEADNGVFHLTTNLLLRGTKRRSADALFDEIEAMGGSVSAISGHQACGVSINLLRLDLEYGIELLADVLMNPLFDPLELDKLKTEAMIAIQAEEDDWFALGKRQFLETMFQVHPERLRPSGSEKSLARLNRESVVNCYHRCFVSNNMTLGVFGDIELDGVEGLIKRRLGAFQPAALSFPSAPVEPPLKDIRRMERHKRLAQAIIFQGYPGIPLQHSDRGIVEILSSVLFGGGQPGGRLYKRLRNEQLVYYIHGYSSFGLDHGYLVIYASAATQNVERLLKFIDQELLDVQYNGISESELESGKQMCRMNYLIGSQAISTQAAIAVLDELYGLGYDHCNQYLKKIASVTREEVQRAASAYLPLDRRVISIIRSQN